MAERPGEELEVLAAMGFAVLAATFVTEPETWPVFLAWAAGQVQAPAHPDFNREHGRYLTGVLGEGLVFLRE